MFLRRKCMGIVFDMDGTLTVPVLDFAVMRQRIGKPTGDVLENVTPEQMAIIEEMEADAAKKLELPRGCRKVLRHIRDTLKVPMAIFTRNTRVSAKAFTSYVEREEDGKVFFTHVFSREDLPVKPDPYNLHRVAEHWGIAAKHIIMVGDARDDVLAGYRAGSSTVFITNGETTATSRLMDQLAQGRTEQERAADVTIAPCHVIDALEGLEDVLRLRYCFESEGNF